MSPRNWKLPLWAQSKWIQWGILTTVLSLACGFLVGRYSLNESPKSSPTGPAQQWQQTGLNFQLLSPLFEGPVCQRDRATMAACLKAIGSLLARHPTRPTLQLIRLHGPPVLWSQEPIGLYGNNLETKDETTRLVPSAPESITSSTQPSSAPATAKKATTQDSLIDALLAHPKSHQALSQLGRWIESTILPLDPHQSAMWIAQSYNHFLTLALDAHAAIIPRSAHQGTVSNRPHPPIHRGFGLEMKVSQKKIFVRTVLPGSSSAKAGLRRGDEIIAIGHYQQPHLGFNIPEAQKELQRAAQEGLPLVISWRNLGAVNTRVLTAKPITVANVESELLTIRHRPIAYIQIRQFSHDTCVTTRRALNEIPNYVEGLILDLRNNRGGLISEANCLLDLFLPKGAVLSELRFFDPKTAPIKYLANSPQQINLTVTVLINSKTASAAEIVAGTLQYYHRATIVGDRSYGKGTFQETQPWDYLPESILIKRTVGYYFLANGTSPQKRGIRPNLVVEADPSAQREGDQFPPIQISEPFISSQPGMQKPITTTYMATSNDRQEAALAEVDPSLVVAAKSFAK